MTSSSLTKPIIITILSLSIDFLFFTTVICSSDSLIFFIDDHSVIFGTLFCSATSLYLSTCLIGLIFFFFPFGTAKVV